MKILFCSPLGLVGGIARWTDHILQYYKSVKPEDIKLYQYYGTLKNNNAGGFHLFARIFEGIREYYPMLQTIKHFFSKENYDIIHLCSSASMGLIRDLLILRLAEKNHVKSIVHFHFGRIPSLFKKKNWEYYLICKVMKMADKVIVIDSKSYDTLKSNGIVNAEYLPNPLTPEVSNIINKNKKIVRHAKTVVFVGHVIETKGVFELIEACQQLTGIRLKLIGFVTPEMRLALQKRAGDNWNTWLDITGEKNYESTIKELLAAGLFVLPSYTEGFPNVIIESMACACPIVATNVGAIPEMLDIRNGFNNGICVNPKDIEGLKNAIEQMLKNEEYALQCGLHAQQRVQQLYAMPIIWKRLVEIWTT